MKVKRLTRHPAFTVGDVYNITTSGGVTNDNGRKMYVNVVHPKVRRNWAIIGVEADHAFDALRFAGTETGRFPKQPTNTISSLPKENNMAPTLTLKKTTLINGRDCDTVDLELILELIDEEQKKIDRLQKTLAGSKAITKLTKKHKDNITALIKIVDARPVE